MKKSDVKRLIENETDKLLIPYGFKREKSYLVKNDGNFYIEYLMSLADYGFIFYSSFCLSCGFTSLNKALSLICNTDGYTKFHLSICQVHLYEDNKFRSYEYALKQESDISTMIQEIVEYVTANLLPLFNGLNSFKSLLHYIRNSHKKAGNGCLAIMLAAIVDDLDYEMLKAEYRRLAEVGPVYITEDLEKVIAYIESHSREELLAIANGG